MPGEWIFEFKYANKGSLNVTKYQEFLKKIREEFEPQFALLDSSVGKAEWTPHTDGTAPTDNIFAKFSYKCVKVHVPKGANHATWTLLWNPKLSEVKNNLHARCAPPLFKELSDKLQKKLVNEYPGHFTLKWNNGLTGYSGYSHPHEDYSIIQSITEGIANMFGFGLGAGTSEGDASGHAIGVTGGAAGGTRSRGRGRFAQAAEETAELSRRQKEELDDLARYMQIQAKWDDSDEDESERCIHHLPWSYCCDCSEDLLEMYDCY